MMQIENGVLIIGSNNMELPQLELDAQVSAWHVPAEYRDNGLFVAVDLPGQPREIPACAPELAEFIGTLEYPASEAARLREAKRQALVEINGQCDTALAELAASYPEGEIKSWPQQVKEADALAVDPDASAPLLEAIAAERGITVQDLADRVHTKMNAYALHSGALIGRRQAAEDQIEAAATLAELTAIEW